VKYFAARYPNSRDFRAPDPRRFQHFQGNGVSRDARTSFAFCARIKSSSASGEPRSLKETVPRARLQIGNARESALARGGFSPGTNSIPR